jgi:hypothetical protein
VDGLASYANDLDQNGTTDNDGDSGIGPHGITVRGSNAIFITSGGPTAPTDAAGNAISREALAAENPAADLFGRLLHVRRDGRLRSLADIYAFERDVNPDAQVGNPAIDTNATDVLIDRGRFVIADAGGNSVLVARGGQLSALAMFANRVVPNPHPFGPPEVPMQAVPTGIVEGPDGAYYMSQLTGFPFPDGTLTEPGGIAVGDHGDLFVTNRSRSPDDGQVLRISADP